MNVAEKIAFCTMPHQRHKSFPVIGGFMPLFYAHSSLSIAVFITEELVMVAKIIKLIVSTTFLTTIMVVKAL